MKATAILWPAIAHVVLVYAVYGVLLRRRWAAVRAGEAGLSNFEGRGAEPASSSTVANNLLNQFELPVLFHVACIALYATGGVSTAAVIFAWIFSVSRYGHAWIHLFQNRVLRRQRAFAVGFLANAALWIAFAAHLLSG